MKKLLSYSGPETHMIWDRAPHCAFTDIARFNDRWFVCFRESDTHALGQLGVVRVIASTDGANWESAAEFQMDGRDLRDPHFSNPGDGRLMLNFGGRRQADGTYHDTCSFAVFCGADGRWGEPTAMDAEGYWIWQVRWHAGSAWSWSRKTTEGLPLSLLRSNNGINWDILRTEEFGNETAIHFQPDGEMLALRRPKGTIRTTRLGHSRPPYTDLQWQDLCGFLGGPLLFALDDGRLLAGGRIHRNPDSENKEPCFAIGQVHPATNEMRILVEFESSKDASYPGMAQLGSELLISHYAGAKEGGAKIYLTRLPVSALGLD